MSFEYKDEKRNVLAVANIRNRSYFGTIKNTQDGQDNNKTY